MKNRAIYSIIASFLLISNLSSCKKDNSSSPRVSVYVAGTYTPAGKTQTAAYWLNGVLNPLEDGTVPSAAEAIVVSDGIVYVGGEYNGKPCIWIGNKRINLYIKQSGDLYISGLGKVNDLGKFNNNIFPAGVVKSPQDNQNHAFVLLDNENLFYEGVGPSEVSDINIAEGISYFAGLLNGQAGYWSGNGRVNLGKSNSTTGIRVANGKVYISGTFDKNNTNSYESGYWDGATFKNLGTLITTVTTDLELDNNGVIYVSGYTADPNVIARATLWKNDQPNKLSIKKSIANAVFLFNGTPYTTGSIEDGVCYWINDKPQIITTPNSVGNAIYVVNE